MSLHKFADMVAKQGRGDDSLLIHMTPDEVRNLQKFAEANGKTLTINPTTGLPEAGMLSDLFKTIAPIALGAFLGPAGVALGGPGLTAGMAGLATGGITALATGSLSRGLMAGLGAYGGAGIGESLMNAGTGALSQSVGAGLSEEAAQQAVASKLASATPMETLTAGFNSATATPAAMGTFAKNNLANIGMAAAPIMAGAMVPTTTKMPENTNPAYIRQKLYDPYTQTYKSLTPVKASEFGGRNFSDAYTNPQTGQMDTLQPRAPLGFAGGGIVALAGGGVPGYAPGGYVPSDTDIFNYFKTPGLSDTQIAADMQKFGVSAADIARATGTQGQQTDYEKRFVNTLIAPGTDASEFQKATSAVGLQNQALATAMQNAGLSQGAQYALTQPAMSDAGFTGGIIDSKTGKAVDLYNQIGYTAGALPGDKGGLEGLYGNINYVSSGLQNLIDTGKMSVADAQNAALAELARTGVSVADVKAATGKDFGNLFKPKTTTETKLNCPAGYRPNAAGTACELIPITNPPPDPFVNVTPTGFYGNDTGNPLTRTPGDITTNKDGTVTVTPNIPGRPDGGFTGMGQVRDTYTAGGGSLGYTAPVPKTAAEHNAMYNKLTDDSLDAYNFLMGKGKNLTQRKAETRDRPVMARYDEAVLGKKAVPRAKTTTTAKTVTGVPGQPQTYFNEAEYLAANPDVAAELKSGKSNFTSAYEHYLMYGKAEGRPFTGDYEGYTTAAALADAANASGGGGADAPPGPPSPGESAIGSDGGMTAKNGGMMGYAIGGGLGSLGSYSDGGRLLRGPGDGVSDSIPATIGRKRQPARLADGEFVIPARIVSELGNGSTDAGAKKLYAMMDRVQRARGKTTGKNKVAANSRSDKYLPA